MANVYVLRESAWLTVDGSQRLFHKGLLVNEDDAVYKAYSGMFDPVEEMTRDVEQATAAPGEARDVKLGGAKGKT